MPTPIPFPDKAAVDRAHADRLRADDHAYQRELRRLGEQERQMELRRAARIDGHADGYRDGFKSGTSWGMVPGFAFGALFVFGFVQLGGAWPAIAKWLGL